MCSFSVTLYRRVSVGSAKEMMVVEERRRDQVVGWLKVERINRADWRLIRRLHRRPRFSGRCNFFASCLSFVLAFWDLRLSDPSCALHRVPFFPSPSSCCPAVVDTGSYTRTCTYIHVYIYIYIYKACGEPPFQWWFCKIVAETRMLDDEIDAGTKAGKKPSGFFHFRNDARILLRPLRQPELYLLAILVSRFFRGWDME